MRQLLPSRPGHGTDRAWLIFTLICSALVWLAWAGPDFATAQEPKADMAAKDTAQGGICRVRWTPKVVEVRDEHAGGEVRTDVAKLRHPLQTIQ